MQKKHLGKGLEALIPKKAQEAGITLVDVQEVKESHLQPRIDMSEEKLQELTESVKQRGFLQPIIVRRKEGHFEVVAGHRRFEVARRLKLEEIPAIIKDFTDKESLETGIIENLHRHDLNPLEQALAFKRLMDEFGYSLEEISGFLGKEKTTISNILRLLKLPRVIQEALQAEKITEGHGRALLGIEDPKKQMLIFERLLEDKISVRDLESIGRKTKGRGKSLKRSPEIQALEDELQKRLKTKVIVRGRNKKYKVLVELYSIQEIKNFLGRIKP